MRQEINFQAVNNRAKNCHSKVFLTANICCTVLNMFIAVTILSIEYNCKMYTYPIVCLQYYYLFATV